MLKDLMPMSLAKRFNGVVEPSWVVEQGPLVEQDQVVEQVQVTDTCHEVVLVR